MIALLPLWFGAARYAVTFSVTCWLVLLHALGVVLKVWVRLKVLKSLKNAKVLKSFDIARECA